MMSGVSYRPLIPGEPDPELLWGSVIASSGAIGAAWIVLQIPTPACPFHSLTGIPCPTCGTTRAAISLLQGDIVGALAWNPLMTLVAGGAAIYLLYAAVVVIGKLPRLRWSSPTHSETRWIRLTSVALIAVNWVYLLWRGV